MWQYLLVAAVVLLAGAWPGHALAQDSARNVVEKAVNAHGGKDKMARYTAVRTTTEGTTRVGGHAATFVAQSAAQLPGQMRNELTIDVAGVKISTLQVLNGDKGWVRVMGETQEVSGVTLAELQESLYAAGVESLTPLLDDSAYVLTSLPGRDVGKRPAVGVRIASKGHPDIDLFFDKKTGLLAASQRRSLSADGRDVTLETIYQDYKTFDEVKVATHLVVQHDGEKVMEGKVRAIRFIEKLDKREFVKP